MAIGDEGITGPLVGGTRPTGIVDFVPRRRGQGPTPTPRGPRGAGRDRTARQAGISRAPAPRFPTAGAPRQPRTGGTPGGVALRGRTTFRPGGGGPLPVTRAATPVSTRRSIGGIPQGPSRSTSSTRPTSSARQLLQQEQERREAIRRGVGFRAVRGLRQ